MRVIDYYDLPRGHPLNGKFVGMKESNISDKWVALLHKLPPSVMTNILNTGVGIEIECENTGGHANSTYWHTDSDNSLRGNGLEYRTKYGLRIHHLFHALPEFEATATKSYPARQYSERTSVHVHLDLRRFDEIQIQNLLVLYTMAEDPLFSLAGRLRKDNIFCVPFRNSIPTNNDPNVWEFLNRMQKYTAMNLRALRTFGTVEFRHMEGNDSSERLLTWVLLLALLKEAARTSDPKDLRRKIMQLKNDSQYEKFLKEIFLDFTAFVPWMGHNLDSAVSDSKLFFWDTL